ncbi:MAG: hypothetical protein U0U66_08410 [Cytophagaceae bacterium]
MNELERQLIELCVTDEMFVTIFCSTAHKGFVKDILKTVRKFTNSVSIHYVGEMRTAAEVAVGKRRISVG